jgi:aminopeptidase N
VRLQVERSEEELAFLFAQDSDPFNRWDAGQELATRILLRLISDHQKGHGLRLDSHFVAAIGSTLCNPQMDEAFITEALTLPTEIYLSQQVDVIDVEAIHEARRFMRRALARELRDTFLATYHHNLTPEPYQFSPQAMGKRSLKNLCLAYLMELDDPEIRELGTTQFRTANNMTDTLAALAILADTEGLEREHVLAEFEQRWRHEPLVLDKWFTIQATSRLSDTLAKVQTLMGHPAFTIRNPNRVRSLIGAFCHANLVRFHASDGQGYRFLADRVLELDPLNPQIAARLLGAMSRWRKFDEPRQSLMKGELERILASPSLSNDTFEIASKSLA